MKTISHITIKYILCLFSISICEIYAQNIRFSQFNFAPTVLNAASTGYIDGQYRINSIYRNQWSTVGIPYNSNAISFDGNVRGRSVSTNQIGYGAYMAYDQSGDGALKVIHFMPAAAYHQSLDEAGKYNISLGVQAGFFQKSIDFSALTFPDQYNGSFFDRELTTNQPFVQNNIFNFDAGVGVLWYYTEKGKLPYKIQYEPPVGKILEVELGFSANQISNPRESFLGNPGNRLSHRYALHGKMVYSVVGNLSIHSMFMYLRQSTVSELILGGDLEHIFENISGDVSVSAGVRYRWNDALVIVLGHRRNHWKAGLSFDANMSSLKKVSKGYGAVEISGAYIFKYSKKILCPKMKD